MAQRRPDLGQEVRGLELLDGVVAAGDAEESKLRSALIPVGHLLDASLFDVIGQGDLVGCRRRAGQDVTAGVGNAAQLTDGAEWLCEFDNGPGGR